LKDVSRTNNPDIYMPKESWPGQVPLAVTGRLNAVVSSAGEGYEILKTVKITVIKKSLENNEETHKPHIDTII